MKKASNEKRYQEELRRQSMRLGCRINRRAYFEFIEKHWSPGDPAKFGTLDVFVAHVCQGPKQTKGVRTGGRGTRDGSCPGELLICHESFPMRKFARVKRALASDLRRR